MNTSFSSTISKDEIKYSLLQKIDLYKRRKWIDGTEEERFRNFLTSSNEDDDPITMDKHLEGVEKWLNAIEMAHGKEGNKRSGKSSSISQGSNLKKKEKQISSASNGLSSKDQQLRNKLLATIKVYKQRQWIDDTEEDGLRSLLSTNEIDGFVPSTQALEAMEKRLIDIKVQRRKEEKELKRVTIKKLPSTETTSSKVEDRNCADYYQIHNVEDLVDTLRYDITDRLFTEMCIFARMSFLQPTSCLECAFKQSQGKQHQERINLVNAGPCSNYVVWRRDANICLHPEKLDSNLMIISCSTAKAWIRGETIQGYKWEKNCKQVINVLKQ